MPGFLKPDPSPSPKILSGGLTVGEGDSGKRTEALVVSDVGKACVGANASGGVCDAVGALTGKAREQVRAVVREVYEGTGRFEMGKCLMKTGEGVSGHPRLWKNASRVVGNASGEKAGVARGWRAQIAIVAKVEGPDTLRRWGENVLANWEEEGKNGSKEGTICGEGFVIGIAVESRMLYVGAGARVAEKVGEESLAKIRAQMRETLAAWENGVVTRALLEAIEAIGRAEGERPPPPPRTWRDTVHDFLGDVLGVPKHVLQFLGSALLWAWEYFPLIYLLGLTLGTLAQCIDPLIPERLVFWRRRRESARREGARGSPERFDAIINALRKVDVAKVSAGEWNHIGRKWNVVPARNCAICLDGFGPASPTNSRDGLAMDETTPLLTSRDAAVQIEELDLRALTCGHVLHRECIRLWLESTPARQRTCPLCRTDDPV